MTDTTPENLNIQVPPQGGYLAKTCARRAHLEHDEAYADVELEPIPDAVQARMASGVEFEAEIGDVLSGLLSVTNIGARLLAVADDPKLDVATKIAKIGPKLSTADAIWVPSCDRSVESKRRREVLTLAAMAGGARFIWNARLPAIGTMVGEPDFLVRVGDEPRADGRWAYAGGDVKDHRDCEGTAKPKPRLVSDMSDPWLDSAATVAVEGTPRLVDSIQLSHYAEHLAALGHGQDGTVIWGGVIGRERRILWRELSGAETHMYVDRSTGIKRRMTPLEIYRQEFSHRVEIIRNALDDTAETPLALPEWKDECKSCQWRTVCHDELVEADHITLLPGLTAAKAPAHYAAGVTKRNQIAKFDWVTARAIDAGVDVHSLLPQARSAAADTPSVSLLRTRGGKAALAEAGLDTAGDIAKLDDRTAAAYAGVKVNGLAAAIDAARVQRAGKVHLARGVDRLELPRADIELDVDMENDAGGLIYLWGTRLTVRYDGMRIPGAPYRAFATFEPNDDAGEAEAFAGLWSWLGCLITLASASGLTFKAYCYTAAEARCFRALARKHAGVRGIPTIDEVEEFLASEYWVDMYPVVANQLLWPTEDLSLKSVAKWARFSWRDTDASGDSSTVWYRQAAAGDVDAQRRLLDYNEDDVTATLVLRDWLTRLSSARQVGDRLPSIAALDRRFGPKPARKARQAVTA